MIIHLYYSNEVAKKKKKSATASLKWNFREFGRFSIDSTPKHLTYIEKCIFFSETSRFKN